MADRTKLLLRRQPSWREHRRFRKGIRKIPQLCNGCQGENFTRTTQYDVCTDCGVCHPYFISDWINYTKDWIYRKSIYRRKTHSLTILNSVKAQIPHQIRKYLLDSLDVICKLFDQMQNKERHNMYNYNFLICRLLDVKHLPALKQHFPEPKTKHVLKENWVFWNKISSNFIN